MQRVILSGTGPSAWPKGQVESKDPYLLWSVSLRKRHGKRRLYRKIGGVKCEHRS